MTDQPSPGLDVDEDTVAAFAAHLEEFAATLSEREYNLLASLLLSVLDPLERLRLRNPAEFLSADEAAILEALEHER